MSKINLMNTLNDINSNMNMSFIPTEDSNTDE